MTSSLLRNFVGGYVSPDAKLRIQPDGSFTLEISQEQVVGTTGIQTSCDTVRTGSLQILSNGGVMLLNFETSNWQRGLADPTSGESPLCLDYAAAVKASPQPLEFAVMGQVKDAFLLLPPGHVLGQNLSLESASGMSAFVSNQFALLFASRDQSVDVTDLAGPVLQGTIRGDRGGAVFGIDSDLREFHLMNSECSIDTMVGFEIDASNGELTLSVLSESPLEGVPTVAGQSPSTCAEQQQLMNPHFGGGQAFDVSDPSDIVGQGPFGATPQGEPPLTFRRSF